MKKSTIIISIIAAVLGGFVGYLITAYAPEDQLVIYLIIVCLTLYLSNLLSIIIHESGHLVMGLLTGYQFISFRIGKQILLKQDGHFKIKKYNLAGTKGQCLLMPPNYSENLPYFWYNFGGGLFNLLAAIIAFGLSFCFKDNLIIYLFMAINLFVALTNLIPLKLTVPNDGYNLYMLSKDKSCRYGLYSQMKIYALSVQHQRHQDMDPSLFELPKDADLNNPLNQSILVNQVSLLHDLHKFPEAKLLIEQINQECQLMELYKNELDCEYLFYCLYEDPHDPNINQLYQDLFKFIKITSKTSLERQRLLYAFEFLVNHDQSKAQKHLEVFEKIAKNYPFDPIITCEREIITLIQNKI